MGEVALPSLLILSLLAASHLVNAQGEMNDPMYMSTDFDMTESFSLGRRFGSKDAAPLAGCDAVLEDEIDFTFNDIKDTTRAPDNGRQAKDALECCQRCQNTIGCLFFTFNKENKGCWLKDSSAGRGERVTGFSGTMRNPKPLPPVPQGPDPTNTQTDIPTQTGGMTNTPVNNNNNNGNTNGNQGSGPVNNGQNPGSGGTTWFGWGVGTLVQDNTNGGNVVRFGSGVGMPVDNGNNPGFDPNNNPTDTTNNDNPFAFLGEPA